MNLRLLLVLISAASYVSIGVVWFITNPSVETKEPQPPFFYTLDPRDIRGISLETQGETLSWSLREEVNRWYFDDLTNIPADMFRWGGITQLLGGPRTQRVLSQYIENPEQYGLGNPKSQFTVTLRDKSKVTLLLGDLTPNGANNYARVEGFPQLVLVDASWGAVLERLVTEPPYPEWYYSSLNGQPREVLLFNNNEVTRAYGWERSEEQWYLCNIPIETDPCSGDRKADTNKVDNELDHFGNPIIGGAVALGLGDDDEHEPYGTIIDSPYIAVRIENLNEETGVTEVTRLTMTIGDTTEDGESRYAVANETSDVILVDAKWADRVLELFFADPLLLENN